MIESMKRRSGLEFGIFDWLDAAGERSTSRVYDDRLALLKRADDGEFTRYHLAEHHGTPLGLASSPVVFLAAAARETQRIKLVPTTVIVPLYDPLRLVQELGMLDQLSHGRLEVGIGKGSSPFEAAMFGLAGDAAARSYSTSTPALLEALESGVFTAPERPDAPVELFIKPETSPAIWYPTSNPDSVPRLAQQGYNTIFGFGFSSPPLDVVRAQSDRFFAIRAETAHPDDAHRPRFGILRHVIVADTDEEAMALARSAFKDHYASFSYLWRKAGSDRFTTMPELGQLVEQHLFFAGSPESVSRQVAHAVSASGANYLAGSFAWGSLPAEAALHSVDLFDRLVIPRVHDDVPLP